jgi:hypothetical protein
VTEEEAQRFADSYGVPYIETSAKTGENVDEAFMMLAERVYAQKTSRKSEDVAIPELKDKDSDGSCC